MDEDEMSDEASEGASGEDDELLEDDAALRAFLRRELFRVAEQMTLPFGPGKQ